MKTTVDISDVLLEEARKLAARDGTTLRAPIEQGLRTVVAQRRRRGGAFNLLVYAHREDFLGESQIVTCLSGPALIAFVSAFRM